MTYMPRTAFYLRRSNGYQYIDEGPHTDSPPVVLLHGMLGDLSNWTNTIGALAKNGYRVIAPVLPVYDLPMKQTSVSGLVDFTCNFLSEIQITQVALVGNSLGGHVALLFALQYPDRVSAMILSGASGIYEVGMGTSTPRRQDRSFIRERAAVTFYDPSHATDELVEEMYEIVNDRSRVVRLIKMARATKEEKVVDQLATVTTPTLLVWGRDDVITPPDVAKTFAERMPNARLRFIEQCGHAPMIEHPLLFNRLMLDFLREVTGAARKVMPAEVQ